MDACTIFTWDDQREAGSIVTCGFYLRNLWARLLELCKFILKFLLWIWSNGRGGGWEKGGSFNYVCLIWGAASNWKICDKGRPQFFNVESILYYKKVTIIMLYSISLSYGGTNFNVKYKTMKKFTIQRTPFGIIF